MTRSDQEIENSKQSNSLPSIGLGKGATAGVATLALMFGSGCSSEAEPERAKPTYSTLPDNGQIMLTEASRHLTKRTDLRRNMQSLQMALDEASREYAKQDDGTSDAVDWVQSSRTIDNLKNTLDVMGKAIDTAAADPDFSGAVAELRPLFSKVAALAQSLDNPASAFGNASKGANSDGYQDLIDARSAAAGMAIALEWDLKRLENHAPAATLVGLVTGLDKAEREIGAVIDGVRYKYSAWFNDNREQAADILNSLKDTARTVQEASNSAVLASIKDDLRDLSTEINDVIKSMSDSATIDAEWSSGSSSVGYALATQARDHMAAVKRAAQTTLEQDLGMKPMTAQQAEAAGHTTVINQGMGTGEMFFWMWALGGPGGGYNYHYYPSSYGGMRSDRLYESSTYRTYNSTRGKTASKVSSSSSSSRYSSQTATKNAFQRASSKSSGSSKSGGTYAKGTSKGKGGAGS